MGFFPFPVLWVIYYIILCFLRHYFAAHPTTATLFSVVTRVSRSRRTRKFAQDSTVRAEYLVRAGLDGSSRELVPNRKITEHTSTNHFRLRAQPIRALPDGCRNTTNRAQRLLATVA